MEKARLACAIIFFVTSLAACSSSDDDDNSGGTGASANGGASGSGGQGAAGSGAGGSNSGGSGGTNSAGTGGGSSCPTKPIVVSCTQEGNGTKLCSEYTGTHYDAEGYISSYCTTIGNNIATPNGTNPCDRSSADYFGSCLLGCGTPDEVIAVYYTNVNVDVVCTNQAGIWFDKDTPVR